MGGRPPSGRTRVKRLPDRGAYDREQIDAILDAGLVCHLGFVHDGHPFVIPTLHGRVGDEVFVHGSSTSRMLLTLEDGVDACLTVTLVDGLVLARSIFHHSINYRSVVVLGRAVEVTDPDEKVRALEAFGERILPGRWAEVRPPTRTELKATSILRLPLDEASAKLREGPPKDDEEDYELPVCAGVIPLALRTGAPEADPRLAFGLDPPEVPARYGGAQAYAETANSVAAQVALEPTRCCTFVAPASHARLTSPATVAGDGN